MSTSTPLQINQDGTVTGYIKTEMIALENFGLLQITLPIELTTDHVAGRYFLVRCGDRPPNQTLLEADHSWPIYFRRPIFFTAYESLNLTETTEKEDRIKGVATVLIPYSPYTAWSVPLSDQNERKSPRDPGYGWLSNLKANTPVNLIGPLGNGFTLASPSRNLLLVATANRVVKLLPLIDSILNRNGRVTLLVHTNTRGESRTLQKELVPYLPIDVEVQITHDQSKWRKAVSEALLWADQLAGALPPSDYAQLAMQIRERRFHLEEGFAQLLVDSDLLCGVGACLACVVPTANDTHTRACVHGPVFDLVRLSR